MPYLYASDGMFKDESPATLTHPGFISVLASKVIPPFRRIGYSPKLESSPPTSGPWEDYCRMEA